MRATDTTEPSDGHPFSAKRLLFLRGNPSDVARERRVIRESADGAMLVIHRYSSLQIDDGKRRGNADYNRARGSESVTDLHIGAVAVIETAKESGAGTCKDIRPEADGRVLRDGPVEPRPDKSSGVLEIFLDFISI